MASLLSSSVNLNLILTFFKHALSRSVGAFENLTGCAFTLVSIYSILDDKLAVIEFDIESTVTVVLCHL